MATSSIPFAVLLLLAAAAASTASARPCKSLFYISATTTTAYYPYKSINRETDPDSVLLIRNPSSLTFIFTATTRYTNRRSSLNFASGGASDANSQSVSKFYSSVSSSIRDRTRDIMSVLVSLLFGVGCGVITGFCVYLLCAFFSSPRSGFDDFASSEEDDVAVAKKLVYVAIPTIDDDLKKPVLPAKGVV